MVKQKQFKPWVAILLIILFFGGVYILLQLSLRAAFHSDLHVPRPDSNTLPQSFEWISLNTALQNGFTKESSHISHRWEFGKKALDEETLQLGIYRDGAKVVFAGYAKDKNYAYIWDNVLFSPSLQIIPDAQPNSFVILRPNICRGGCNVSEEGYSKDALHVYYREKPLFGADPATFKIVDPTKAISKDKNYMYRWEVRLPKEIDDPKRFEQEYSSNVQSSKYFKDGSHVYWYSDLQSGEYTVVAGADAKSFSIIELHPNTCGYGCDGQDEYHTYWQGVMVH